MKSALRSSLIPYGSSACVTDTGKSVKDERWYRASIRIHILNFKVTVSVYRYMTLLQLIQWILACTLILERHWLLFTTMINFHASEAKTSNYTNKNFWLKFRIEFFIVIPLKCLTFSTGYSDRGHRLINIFQKHSHYGKVSFKR